MGGCFFELKRAAARAPMGSRAKRGMEDLTRGLTMR
jgi:hypothetical protein